MMAKAIPLVWMTFVLHCAVAPSRGDQYSWNVQSGRFETAGNWDPPRDFPSSNDWLYVQNGGACLF